MKKYQQGFSAVEAVIILVVIGAIGAAGYLVMKKDKNPTNSSPTTNTQQPAAQSASVSWMQTEDGYAPSATPPACPAKIVQQFPADISKVTSVLYPGQLRGGSYKPHGGLRFDKSANDQITVKAPFDGTIIDGAAYLADGAVNDVQYTFDVMNDCGMMFRVGHLLTLSPAMAELAKNFPAPKKDDSRTTKIDPGVKIKAGDPIATGVGTSSDKNVFFDWGIYNWNQPNAISSDAAWLKDAQHNNPLAKHAICWFGQLSASNEATIRSLPAGDPASGKNSDYCK